MRLGTVTTYKLRSISDAVEIGTTLGRSWFRGHPRIHNNLTPKIFRPEWDDLWMLRGRDVELGIIDDFKRRAPGLMESPPSPSDTLAWLFHMQHHGAPYVVIRRSGAMRSDRCQSSTRDAGY